MVPDMEESNNLFHWAKAFLSSWQLLSRLSVLLFVYGTLNAIVFLTRARRWPLTRPSCSPRSILICHILTYTLTAGLAVRVCYSYDVLFRRTPVSPGRRLHVAPVPRRRDLRHEPHKWFVHVLLCERLQRGWLQRGHQRVWAGVPVWARRDLRQHAGLVRV
jgi:hypothetical protein